jgi:hypothetical protein
MGSRSTLRGLALFGFFGLSPSLTAAQSPDTFKNLQVLPKDVTRQQLMNTMFGFADALGVECAHCHAGGDPRTLEGVDFASDEKWEKRTARSMMRMVSAVNGDFISKLEPRPAAGGKKAPTVRVECVTCHHTVLRPETISAIFSRDLDEHGPEAAIRAYKDLRVQYLERGGYNFSDGPLNAIGEELLKAHREREALLVLEYNVESHPSAAWSWYGLGEARLATGDRPGALAAFQRSLTLQPDIEGAQKRVLELSTAAPPKP